MSISVMTECLVVCMSHLKAELDVMCCTFQALKFESYHTATLAQFLLERSMASVRVAHQLYW